MARTQRAKGTISSKCQRGARPQCPILPITISFFYLSSVFRGERSPFYGGGRSFSLHLVSYVVVCICGTVFPLAVPLHPFMTRHLSIGVAGFLRLWGGCASALRRRGAGYSSAEPSVFADMHFPKVQYLHHELHFNDNYWRKYAVSTAV